MSTKFFNGSRIASLVGLVGGALHWLAPRVANLPQDTAGIGLGPSLTTPVFSAVGVLAVIGSLLSLPVRSRLLAALSSACLTVSVVSSALVVEREFKLIVGLLTLLLVAACAGVWWTSRDVPRRRAAMLLGATGGLAIWAAVSISLLGQVDDAYGPTHPESTALASESIAEWLWVGAVDDESATVVAGGLDDGAHQLWYWPRDLDNGVVAEALTVDVGPYGVARFEVGGLQADTQYHYQVVTSQDDAGEPSNVDGMFRTFADGAQDLTLVLGSCARTDSNGAVFDSMLGEEPDLYLNLGDMHYANLVSDDPADHVDVLGRALARPGQSALVRNVPTAHIWDDHDYGDNNTDSSSPSRQAALDAYRVGVPHYDVDADGSEQINQAFTVGRVRIVMTDTRSAKTADTMLGAAQEAWLIDELVAASKTHAVVIWASSTPWIGVDTPGADNWSGYADQRSRIADAIADASIDNLVMVSGDNHLTALDDGTNTAYADDGSPGFPLIHAGPLDRLARVATIDYSHGSFSDPGQYGTVRVSDSGGAIVTVTLAGHRWDGETLGTLDLEFAAP